MRLRQGQPEWTRGRVQACPEWAQETVAGKELKSGDNSFKEFSCAVVERNSYDGGGIKRRLFLKMREKKKFVCWWDRVSKGGKPTLSKGTRNCSRGCSTLRGASSPPAALTLPSPTDSNHALGPGRVCLGETGKGVKGSQTGLSKPLSELHS